MNYRDYDPIVALHKVTHRCPFGGVNPPDITSITFDHDPTLINAGFAGILGPSEDHYIYGRLSGPNNAYLESQISAIEDAEWTETFASGQGAMSAVINALTKPGDVIVASTRLYGGTLNHLRSLESDRGVRVAFVDVTDPLQLAKAGAEQKPKLVLVEAISNPSLFAADIANCAKVAHANGALLVVDNTFTPLVVLPLRLGADIVVHSLTKYMSGKSDHLGGSVSIRRQLPLHVKANIASYLAKHGAVLDRSVAHDLLIRLPSMWHSYKTASEAALHVARNMQQKGLRVFYPGLSSHPQRSVVRKIFRTQELGYGGMIAVDFGAPNEAMRFIRKIREEKIGYSAVSLGSNHLYVCAPVSSVSSAATEDVPPELTPALVRISVGDNLPANILWEKLRKIL